MKLRVRHRRRRLAGALLTLFLNASSFVVMSAEAQDQRDPRKELAALRHEKRVLLVLAPSAGDPTYRAQLQLWADQQAGFTERELVQVPVFTRSQEQGALARKYDAKPGPFAVVLIGKDGHAAFVTDRPVTAAEIFGKIDAMPMRRAEMQRQRRGATAQ